VRPNDVEIVIGTGELAVMGTRFWPDIHSAARVHRLELPHGRFERRLPLPGGTYQLAGKSMVDGCLLLTLRKLV
jgi:HSP20 family protein